MDTARTVSEVARLSGVTVRTLHHYDQIGLLVPNDRNEAGYRLYDAADLARLQQILLYRRLGLGLTEIRRIMSEPDFDRVTALQEQRRKMEVEATRLQRMIGAVDQAIRAGEEGTTMNPEEMFEVFGDFDVAAHDAEAAERWPGDASDESKRRTARYSKEHWLVIRGEERGIAERLAAALASGSPADHADVAAIAEEHRLHIDRWYYPCSPEMHRGLGELYVRDERFAAYWDAYAEGLARYVCDAIAANTGGESA
jgi:DNA-binding transcriptional MerR regulator